MEVQRSGSAGNLENIKIRGSLGTQTLVLVDGFAVNSPTLGQFDISSLPVDGFERIEWTEAFNIVAANINSIRAHFGPDALGFLASAKATNEENYIFQKLARMLGTNNVDHCARL